jgi:hypothetical protein
MKKLTLLLLAVILACSVYSVAQVASASPQTEGKYGASAVWTLSQEFLQAAHAACDKAGSDKVAECFLERMTKAGAPADAVSFTRALYRRTNQFGVMGAIKDYPPVALAWVVFPLRANNSDALLIVNGKPPFLDLDDLHELDSEALKKDPLFLQWKASAPQLEVWPAEHSAGASLVEYQRVWQGPKPGEIQFIVSYPLTNGATCAHSGFANYLWNFDSAGTFLGTKLLSVTRGVPPLKRSFHPAAQPDQTSTTAK